MEQVAGEGRDRFHMPISWPIAPYTPVNVSFSSSGNQTLVSAPTNGAGIGIYGLLLVNASTSTSTVISIYQDGGSTAVGSYILFQNGGNLDLTPRSVVDYKNPYFLTNANAAFVINSSSAVQIYGIAYAAQCP